MSASTKPTNNSGKCPTFVSVFPNGALGFKCHHAHCSDIEGWGGFKELVDRKFADDNPGALPFRWSGTVLCPVGHPTLVLFLPQRNHKKKSV